MTGASEVDAQHAEQAAEHEARAVLMHLLVEMGVPEAEVQAAAASGSLHLMALEQLGLLDDAQYTLEEVAEVAGIPERHIRTYWRALGFPEPPPGEKVFSPVDLDMLTSVVPFIDADEVDVDVAVRMARVIGSSLNRIAQAQIEVIEREVVRTVGLPVDDVEADDGGEGTDREDEATDDALRFMQRAELSEMGVPGDFDEDEPVVPIGAAQRAAELLPMMPKLMEFVWRRHLGAAARRRILRAAGEETFDGVCVGFADLVGFTAQTQLVPEDELAGIVSRFENIAYDVVGGHGGRVVKMIGDEVMFVIDGARAGAELALHLADVYRDDEELSDVRVGLASGSVLEREGDVYGPVVNLASRIVSIAYPASVVVSRDIVDALADGGDIEAESIRSYYLKDIGRVPLWTLRRVQPHRDGSRGAAPPRSDRRRFVIERRAKRQQQVTGLAEELAPELLQAAGELADAAGELVLDIAADLLEEPEFVEGATTGELQALTDVVLAADIDDVLQVELLADIDATRRLQVLEAEAEAKAQEADLEAERKLDEIEEEARRKVEQAEREARFKVEQALNEAEEKARRANEEASRKLKRVAAETEKKAERAEKDAKRDAQRRADRARAERARADRDRDRS